MAVRGTESSHLVTVWNDWRRFARGHPGFAAIVVVVACFVGWIVDLFLAPAIIGFVTRNWPDERLYDPTLGSHMGSNALRFDVQLALVLVFLLPWVAVGVLVAIKTNTPVVAVVPAVVPAVVSTWLFFATGTFACDVGEPGKTDLVFLVSIGLAALLAYAGGAIAGRQQRRPVVAIAILAASSLTIIGHVQWSNCSGFSTQVTRELDAMMIFPFLLAAIAGSASLGRLTSGSLRNRRSTETLGARMS